MSFFIRTSFSLPCVWVCFSKKKENVLIAMIALTPLLLIPFRSGQNISYRHENRYHNTPHSTSDQISAYFGVFQPFWPISAGTSFWLKKKKILPSSSSRFWTLLLLVFFFFFFLLFSSSSVGMATSWVWVRFLHTQT